MLPRISEASEKPFVLHCARPDYLKAGDGVAMISPSYFTPMENVEKTATLLRSWGLEPVIGPNVGKILDGQYAGTLEERIADIRWALQQPGVKAILCNRGGYGSIQLIDRLSLSELRSAAKWLVGFSDISTLHGLMNRAGVMSIHGTMASFLCRGGRDCSSTLLRDLLFGKVPRYELPPHPWNIPGEAEGVLVGGNICTFAPNLGTQADATLAGGLILFIEEVEESQHNIDRQLRFLQMNGVLDRCKGVILGEFTDCGKEFSYSCIEEMLRPILAPYHIPVLCGFPAGHDEVNLPLVLGSRVRMTVGDDAATLRFLLEGEEVPFRTDNLQ